jgi:hypothetical protein
MLTGFLSAVCRLDGASGRQKPPFGISWLAKGTVPLAAMHQMAPTPEKSAIRAYRPHNQPGIPATVSFFSLLFSIIQLRS